MQKDLEGNDVRDEDIPTKEKATCICCGEEKCADEMSPSLGTEEGLVCDGCREDDRCEPVATIVFGGNNDEFMTIGAYHDDSDGLFTARYVPTDGWRGYFEVTSEEYVNIHSDTILAYSEDETQLKNFDDALIEYCVEHDIEYARVFTRTSNVFSSGYDFFVHKDSVGLVENFIKLHKALADMRSRFRDPERQALTALTGKSSEFDAQDKLLLKAAERLRKGDDPDKVIADILEEAAKLK